MAKPVTLTTAARKLTLIASNIVYAPEGVKMIKQALENTKNEKGVIGAVVMFATTVLHKMEKQTANLPEEEMWGKMGVVHSVLSIIFDVAMNLGYKMPQSSLKEAYTMVATQLQAAGNGGGDDEQAEGSQPPAEEQGEPMQGAMPPPDAAQAPPQAMPMQGAMP